MFSDGKYVRGGQRTQERMDPTMGEDDVDHRTIRFTERTLGSTGKLFEAVARRLPRARDSTDTIGERHAFSLLRVLRTADCF